MASKTKNKTANKSGGNGKSNSPAPLVVAKNMSTILNPGPAQWASGWSSFIGTFMNPETISITEFEKMLTTDETFRSGIDFLRMAIIARIGEYTHEDEKISDFITENFQRVKGSLGLIIDEMLTALWAGFSVGEIILDSVGSNWLLRDIQFIHPGTIEFYLHTEGDLKNNIKGIKQVSYYGSGSGINEEIDVEKLLIYTHSGRFSNPYGQSRFKADFSA